MAKYFLIAVLQRSPLLLVAWAAMLFALLRWRRHPRASLLTSIALWFYMFKLFLFTSLNYSIPSMRVSMQWSYSTANLLYSALHVLNDIGFAIVLVLLVMAAFSNRQTIAGTNT